MVLLSELIDLRPQLNPDSMKFLEKLKAFSVALNLAVKARKEKEVEQEKKRIEKEQKKLDQSHSFSHTDSDEN